jgi:hypothetical protein
MCLAGNAGSAVVEDQSTLLLLRLRDAVRVVRFLSARKADLKKGFQHLVVLVVLVVVVLVVGTRVKKRF